MEPEYYCRTAICDMLALNGVHLKSTCMGGLNDEGYEKYQETVYERNEETRKLKVRGRKEKKI